MVYRKNIFQKIINFLALILMTIFTISAYNIKAAMLIYYCQYNLGDISLMPYISFITIGCSCVGITFIPNGVTWAFVSDSIDYGEWKTGERREGITYAFFNFARKIAQSVSGFASGIGLSIVVGFLYTLSDKKHGRIEEQTSAERSLKFFLINK